MKIIIRGHKPQTIDTVLGLRLNGDTANSYFSIYTPTTSSTGQTFSGSFYIMNQNGLSNDTDAQYNSCAIDIPDYASTTNYKAIKQFIGMEVNTLKEKKRKKRSKS